MLQICQISISEYRHCLKQQEEVIHRDENFNQQQEHVQCVFMLICVRATEISLVICRKPHHIERLCTGDERERSHLTAIRDQPCFLFLLFSVTGYSCNHEGVNFPPMLRGYTLLLAISTQFCAAVNILIHLLKSRLCNPGSRTICGLF